MTYQLTKHTEPNCFFCTSGSEDTGGKRERKKKLRRFKRGKQIQMKGVFLMLVNIMRNSSFKSN